MVIKIKIFGYNINMIKTNRQNHKKWVLPVEIISNFKKDFKIHKISAIILSSDMYGYF